DAAQRQHDGDDVPFEGEREERGERGGRLVHGLKEATPENAGIDHRPARQQERGREVAINAAEPFGLAEQVEAERMLAVDERLGLAVAALLVEISLHRVAAEMPDNGRRAEADRVAGILEAPADVDIVAGGAVERVETAETEQ